MSEVQPEIIYFLGTKTCVMCSFCRVQFNREIGQNRKNTAKNVQNTAGMALKLDVKGQIQ